MGEIKNETKAAGVGREVKPQKIISVGVWVLLLVIRARTNLSSLIDRKLLRWLRDVYTLAILISWPDSKDK